MNKHVYLRRYDALVSRLEAWRLQLPAVLADQAAVEVRWPSSCAAGERTAGARTVLDTWCETHGRDVGLCKAHGLECRGLPIPSRSDPTGEAAATAVTATQIEDDLERALVAAEQVTDRIGRRLGDWAREQRELERPAVGEPGCELCWRVVVDKDTNRRLWEPPHVEASDVSGVLDRAHRLCRWCYVFVREHGHKPSMAQCRDHMEGRKVRSGSGECAGCRTVAERESVKVQAAGLVAAGRVPAAPKTQEVEG